MPSLPNARTDELISVRLQLFADLRRFLPKGESGPLRLTLPAGSKVRDLLRAASVPSSEEITIGLNGEQGDLASTLGDGDEVVLFSPMEGG